MSPDRLHWVRDVTDLTGATNIAAASRHGWAEGSFLSSMKRMSQAVEWSADWSTGSWTRKPEARIVVAGEFNAAPDEVPVRGIRVGDVENSGNPDLTGRVLVPAPARYTLVHQGRGEMLDHMLHHPEPARLTTVAQRSTTKSCTTNPTRSPFDRKYPESGHAPVVATFDYPRPMELAEGVSILP